MDASFRLSASGVCGFLIPSRPPICSVRLFKMLTMFLAFSALPLVRVSLCTSPLTKDVHHLFKALVAVHGLRRRSCSNHVLPLTRSLAEWGCLFACYCVLKNRLLNLTIHRAMISVLPHPALFPASSTAMAYWSKVSNRCWCLLMG